MSPVAKGRLASDMRPTAAADPGAESLLLEDQEAWTSWLRANHAASAGVWLRIAKAGTDLRSVSYAQAVEAALCFGWIDGQKKSMDEDSWLQRFTPRSAKSIWSRINRDKAMQLIELRRMEAAGLREVERAKGDGRWEQAYDSPRGATPPPDFQAALEKETKASAFFATLDGRNRYAILFRIQTARKPETRARRIQQFVEMLARHETIHPVARADR